jgi:hypothetical protein
MGYLNQQRKNLRSTKPFEMPDETPQNKPKTHAIYAAIIHIQDGTGRIDTDLTGHFPVTSNAGHKYIFALYDHDSSGILAEPIRSRADMELLCAYNRLHQFLTDRGFKPRLQRLDNEASTALKRRICQHDIDFQLAPPHMHRHNAAERAIQTLKYHFIAILCGTDPDFPLHLWYHLIPQAEATLNILRQSRIHPKLSSHAHLNGPFDFNRTPLAPLGTTKAIAHEKP